MASKTLQVRYVGDVSGLKSALAQANTANTGFVTRIQQASDKVQNLGKSMYRTGRTLSVGLTLPLVALGKVAVDEFTQFQKVNAQTQAVLKSTGNAAHITAQGVTDLSDRLGKLTAQDGEAVHQTENLLLTFTNLTNTVGKGNAVFNRASLAVQDISAAMNQDAKSSAIQLGKALNDPLKGLTSLSRIGVNFTSAMKGAGNITKALAHTIGETWTPSMKGQQITEAEGIKLAMKHNDILGAQKIILGEVSNEFGGSAKAAGKTASPIQKLSLAFRDLAQAVGAILVPILNQIVPIIQSVAEKFQNLSPRTQKLIVIVGILAAALGPVILILGALVTAIGVLMSPITLVIAGVALLAFVVVKNWGTIKRVTLSVWHAVSHAVMTAVHAIVPIISGALKVIAGIWRQGWSMLKALVQLEWSLIKVLIVNRVRDIINFIRPALHVIADNWRTVWNTMKSVFSTVWNALTAIAKPVINALIGMINGLIRGINLAIHGFNLIPGHGDVSSIPSVPYLAQGGIVMRPTLAMIGERGPEAVVPLRGRGAGVGGLHVTINFHGFVGDERRTADEIQRVLVKAARRNGGTLQLT